MEEVFITMTAGVEFVRLTRDEHPYRPLGKLDHSRKSQYLHAVQMQLIPNLFRGWADTGCSSLVGLQSPRCSFKANVTFLTHHVGDISVTLDQFRFFG